MTLKKMPKKIVLAYSGGLDTTYCVKYLQNELGCEVHAALVNTGGFSTTELDSIEQKAKLLGATSFTLLNRIEEYYEKVIKYLIFGNVLKNSTYPLSVSAERTIQAVAIAEFANEIGASAIAHGSTGAGNDQVRFDLAFQVLAPKLEIITPIRDQKLSREYEINYLKQAGVEMNWQKGKYSINKGLWGTSVGGAETLTSSQTLPEDAWPSQLSQTTGQTVTIDFAQGQPVGLNGQKMPAVAVIEELNKLGGSYAIGRDIHVGDTVIGIKGRVGFEAPAAVMLIKAHHTLEKHNLSKWQQHWKEQLANWYGMLLHEAQYLDPVMRNIETFLADTQTYVSGQVSLDLAPYRFSVVGIKSDYDIMQVEGGTYGEMNNAWSGEDVKGFTQILANSLKMFKAKQG
jgi:argininosuccinate synthase